MTKAKLPDHMGAGDVAKAAGVDRRNLYRQAGLPKEDFKTSSGRGWYRETIEAWIKDRKKRGVQQ